MSTRRGLPKVIRRFLFSLLLAACFPASADVGPSRPLADCAVHVPYGQPVAAKQSTTVICRDGYILEHDDLARIPAWVAYTLSPVGSIGCSDRATTFKPDPSVRESAKAKDYAKSGYDIGHMANNADMRWSAKAEEESNLFPNAAPQLPGLNRASWKALEIRTRSWAVGRKNSLLIYVGPIYDLKQDKKIGGRVVVPSAFYKVIVDQKTREVLAFIYPQQESTADPATFKTSLAEVQKQTGIVFPMPAKPRLSKKLWPVTASSIRNRSVSCATQ